MPDQPFRHEAFAARGAHRTLKATRHARTGLGRFVLVLSSLAVASVIIGACSNASADAVTLDRLPVEVKDFVAVTDDAADRVPGCDAISIWSSPASTDSGLVWAQAAAGSGAARSKLAGDTWPRAECRRCGL